MIEFSDMTPEQLALWIKTNHPINSALIFPNGTTVSQRIRYANRPKRKQDWKRKKIKSQSSRSLSRLVFYVAETKYKIATMLTLTYQRYPKSGKIIKKHLDAFLRALKYAFPGCVYVWWLEFQKRGAPHFHLLLNFEPWGDAREKVAQLWCGAIGNFASDDVYAVHSHKAAWETLREWYAPQSYIIKEAGKKEQKNPPTWFTDLGRTWGMSRAIKNNLGQPVTIDADENYLRHLFPEFDKWLFFPKFIYPRVDK